MVFNGPKEHLTLGKRGHGVDNQNTPDLDAFMGDV